MKGIFQMGDIVHVFTIRNVFLKKKLIYLLHHFLERRNICDCQKELSK